MVVVVVGCGDGDDVRVVGWVGVVGVLVFVVGCYYDDCVV